MRNRNRGLGARLGVPMKLGIFALLAMALTGCDDYFDVTNPNLVDAATVDPVEDGTTFSRSAAQTLASAYGDMIVYTAWFTNEAWVGDTFPTRNEYGRRAVAAENGTHANDVWFPLARAISQGELAVEVLTGEEGQELNVARAAMVSGFGLVLMAEAFCEGTMRQAGGEPGGIMTTEELLETAVSRFETAVAQGTASGASEALNVAEASRIGMGRALLQLDRGAEAIAAVQDVADGFDFNFPFVDDAGNRGRLGNGVHFYSAGGSRESLVVPPHYRELGQDLTGDPQVPEGDPRVQFWDSGRNGQDGELRLWSQQKYDNWAAPVSLASGLEARYIEVEARNDPGEMLEFINERREAGGHDPYEGDDLLGELMTQKSLDFWLQAKRMGDWRRNGDAVPNIIEPGDNYYKPAVGQVMDQECWPIPFAERVGNPNIPTS